MTAFDAQAMRRRKARSNRNHPQDQPVAPGNQLDAEKLPNVTQAASSDNESVGEDYTNRNAFEGTAELSSSLTSIHSIIALEHEQKARANVARTRGRALPPQPNPLQAPDPLVAQPVASAIATAAARASAWRHKPHGREATAAGPSATGTFDESPHLGKRSAQPHLPSLHSKLSDNNRRALEPNLMQPSRYWQALGRRPTIPDGTGFLGRFKHAGHTSKDEQRLASEATVGDADGMTAEEYDGAALEAGSSGEHFNAEQLAALEAGGFEEGGTVYIERGWEERLARQRARQAAQAEALAAAEAAAAEEAAEAARRAAPPSGRIKVLARDVNLDRPTSSDAGPGASELVANNVSDEATAEPSEFLRIAVGVVHAVLTLVFDEPPSKGWHLHLEVYRWIAAPKNSFLSADQGDTSTSALCSGVEGANELELSPYDSNPAETALANHSKYNTTSPFEDNGNDASKNYRSATIDVDGKDQIRHISSRLGKSSHGSTVVCCEERLSEGEVLALLNAASRADWIHPRQVNYYDDAQRERLEKALLPFLNERLHIRPTPNASEAEQYFGNVEVLGNAKGTKPNSSGTAATAEVKSASVADLPAPQQFVETYEAHHRIPGSATAGAIVFVRRVFRAAVLLPWGPARQRHAASCLVEAFVLHGGLVRLTALPLGNHRRFSRPPPLVLAWPALARAAEPYLRTSAFELSRQVSDAKATREHVLCATEGVQLEAYLAALCRSRGGLRLANTALGGVRLVIAGESDTSVRTHWGGEVPWHEDGAGVMDALE